MSELRSWFLRNVLEAAERQLGAPAVAGLRDCPPPGGQTLSDVQLTNIANRIANHKHGGHHHRTHGPQGVPTASADPNATSTSDPSASPIF